VLFSPLAAIGYISFSGNLNRSLYRLLINNMIALRWIDRRFDRRRVVKKTTPASQKKGQRETIELLDFKSSIIEPRNAILLPS
jgi:hypothetical protein